jgi:hypothetical protein
MATVIYSYDNAVRSLNNRNTQVSSDDISPGFLYEKLAEGTNVTLTLINAGGDEQVEIASTGGGGGGGALDDLSDVVITTPSDIEYLGYSSGDWINREISIEDLSEIDIFSPSDGDSLLYQSGQWVNGIPSSELEDITDVDVSSINNGDILLNVSGVFTSMFAFPGHMMSNSFSSNSLSSTSSLTIPNDSLSSDAIHGELEVSPTGLFIDANLAGNYVHHLWVKIDGTSDSASGTLELYSWSYDGSMSETLIDVINISSDVHYRNHSFAYYINNTGMYMGFRLQNDSSGDVDVSFNYSIYRTGHSYT